MSNREDFHRIMERKSNHSGFWHGHPNEKATDGLYQSFGVKDDFSLGKKLGSICRWVIPDECEMWKDPEHPKIFDVLGGKERVSLGQPGIFAETESIVEVERFRWPDAKYCDFTETLRQIEKTIAEDQAVLSGTWSCFFHDVCDFFGMENYFIKMYTDPDVVQAVTEHVVNFYLAANEKLFNQAGDKINAFFFGNDFGSQRDLLISPECFDRFIMPYFVKFIDQAHRFGYKVLFHSCGAIDRIIPRLIDAGVDALHPIQAKASNMDAETLAKKYNGKIVFVGGVDTQDLLPNSTPQKIAEEVMRLRELFGDNYIVSPSHESILPGVPAENIAAMAAAAQK